jgi:DNA-binding GntR family transcriptional regulator
VDEALPESRIVTLYDELLRDRATGVLDAEVTETELAGRYGVSRAVLSRALSRLSSQGLIERLRGHGWRFANALESERAYEESYEFRVAIEGAALAAANFRADGTRLAEMRRRHEEILAAPQQVGSREWFETNAAFHEMIAEFSGNRFFQQAIRYQNDLRRLREHAEFSHLSRDRIEQSCREHLGILEAIEQGDRDWASALLRRHLLQALDYSSLPE